MAVYKITDLLYRNAKREKVRLTGAKVLSVAPTGIYSSCRGSGVSSSIPAKLSNVALVLDMIFQDHKVMIGQSGSQVHTRFEYMGTIYEAVVDETLNTGWVSAPPVGWPLLIPYVAWTLSDCFTGDNASELKGYFEDIKKGNKNAVFLFCDAFYYGFAKEAGNVNSDTSSLKRENLTRAYATGLFRELNLMRGLTDGISRGAVMADPIESEEEPGDDFMVKYDGWTEEQKTKIPDQSALSTYVMTDHTKAVARKVKYRMDKVLNRMNEGATGMKAIQDDYVNILMVGRPATGKTSLANAVAAMTGMPIYTVPFSKHTEEDTVEGKNKVVNGEIGFVETEFLKAYQEGGIIVCEEINLADPSVVMGALGQAMEKPFVIMKDGYQPVHRHPLCIIIGTMNTGTAGSKQLNQALSSRFKNTYVLDDPDKNTFVNILASKGYLKKNCRYVHDAYNRIINYLKDPQQSQEELTENITLRACLGALESMEEGESAKEAIKNSLVGKIAEVDLEVARDVEDHVVSCLPNR